MSAFLVVVSNRVNNSWKCRHSDPVLLKQHNSGLELNLLRDSVFDLSTHILFIDTVAWVHVTKYGTQNMYTKGKITKAMQNNQHQLKIHL